MLFCLTSEHATLAGYVSQKVEFTRYQLCRIIGWQPDGRSYARLEASLDRMKATTLKFKDSWYDNSEKEYKSRTFSIIEDVELCSRDQIDRARLNGGNQSQTKCSFRWSDVV
jgi:plasmid replication initiation protein